jgi:hypothetical protein
MSKCAEIAYRAGTETFGALPRADFGNGAESKSLLQKRLIDPSKAIA